MNSLKKSLLNNLVNNNVNKKKPPKSFTDCAFWKHPGIPRVGGLSAVPFVHKLNPRVFCVYARNRNENLAVFEGILNSKNELVGIDHYWLLLEHSFLVESRAKGIQHDREEMTTFDDIAYGYSNTVLKPGVKHRVVMKNLKSHPLIVVADKKGGVDAYVSMGTSNKKRLCLLKHVWVEDNGKRWAKVKYVDIFGKDVRTGELVQE